MKTVKRKKDSQRINKQKFTLIYVNSNIYYINFNLLFCGSTFMNLFTASKSSSKKFDNSPLVCTGRNIRMYKKRLKSMI